jgi:hypothetical protein
LKSGSNPSPDFKEFLSLLLDAKVEFALVGGYAVAYHGYPRYTGDMDILVARDAMNAEKVIQLGYPPVRIDLITSIDGVENEEVLAGIVAGDFFGMRIPIISLEHLKRNKRATGRAQDLSDLNNLP